jgi:hypothetical protein
VTKASVISLERVPVDITGDLESRDIVVVLGGVIYACDIGQEVKG